MPAEPAIPSHSKRSDNQPTIVKDDNPPQKLPKGVVLGKDGKP